MPAEIPALVHSSTPGAGSAPDVRKFRSFGRAHHRRYEAKVVRYQGLCLVNLTIYKEWSYGSKLGKHRQLLRPAMDSIYFLGIPEIDAQHDEIVGVVKTLQEAIAEKQFQRVQPLMMNLYQVLNTHFAYEESFMGVINSPDLAQHREFHKHILNLFVDFFDLPSAPADYEPFGKMIGDAVITHVLDEDRHLSESIKQLLQNYQQIHATKEN